MDLIQTDSVIYRILTESHLLDITGGIYTAGERPDNSDREDIVINNISYEHSTPRRGVSNVNIHVPDIAVTIDDIQQYKTDRDRLQDLTQIVTTIIETTNIEGVAIHIETTQVFAEPNAHEHYMNIRCSWLIAKPYTNELDITESDALRRLADLERRVKTLEDAAQPETSDEPTAPENPTPENE